MKTGMVVRHRRTGLLGTVIGESVKGIDQMWDVRWGAGLVERNCLSSNLERAKVWHGSAPVKCDVCKGRISSHFYDCAVPGFRGMWGNLCSKCFTEQRCSVGTGRGQEYTQVGTSWVKTAG